MNLEKATKKEWLLVDCTDQPVGRLATRIADILRGKHRPSFTPHQDTGDFVIAINVEKITLTGDKWRQKIYWSHSGYPGGIKGISAKEMRAKHPERILRKAVAGMLPKNRLSDLLITKLKIYAGQEHPHQAQQPIAAV
ncbi:MAG: 50S ribosomal protein L13 [Deltaproteobacteria bacterium]|nr:50S ribosomal protein L13 [Deltaproteobacteria bacterium]